VGIVHLVLISAAEGGAGAAADAETGEAGAATSEAGAGSEGASAGGGDPGGSGGGGCFVAGTPVQMADGTTKAIEQIQPGDMVMSRNPATGETAARQVVRTFVHQHPGTLVLHLASGEAIETTVEHPFWVAGAGWVPAGRLAIGTSVITRAGPTVQVVGIEHRPSKARVYNFEVEEFHTYFVGTSEGGIWVHNTCPSSWADPKTLARHFEDHGGDFGATTEEEYANMAHDFYTNSDGLPTKIDTDGTVRIYERDSNTFGSYTSDGRTFTYFKPEEGEAYWDAQPGADVIW
jgi:hypothetical protein